jgi:hypothetical protein
MFGLGLSEANRELGEGIHTIVGDYLPRIAALNGAPRYELVSEMAVKMYDVHAEFRMKLVRAGYPEDITLFDQEHGFRGYLAVWQVLNDVPLDETDKSAVHMALAGCRSRWLAKALQKAGSAPEPEISESKAIDKTDPRNWPETARNHEAIKQIKEIHQLPREPVPEIEARYYLAEKHGIEPQDVTQQQLTTYVISLAPHYGAAELIAEDQPPAPAQAAGASESKGQLIVARAVLLRSYRATLPKVSNKQIY